MAAPLTAERADAALQGVTVNGASRKAANRQLRKWAEDDPAIKADEDNVKLYLALKEILAESNERVTPDIMKESKRELVSSTAWVQQVNLLPKLRKLDLDTLTWTSQELQKTEKVKDYLLDPRYLTSGSIPAGCDPNEHWFVYTNVPVSVLGPGVTQIQVSVSSNVRLMVPSQSGAILDAPQLSWT